MLQWQRTELVLNHLMSYTRHNRLKVPTCYTDANGGKCFKFIKLIAMIDNHTTHTLHPFSSCPLPSPHLPTTVSKWYIAVIPAVLATVQEWLPLSLLWTEAKVRSGPSTVTLPLGVTGDLSFPNVMFNSSGLPGIGVQLKTNMSPIITNTSGGGSPSVGESGGEGCLHITTLHFSVSDVHTSTPHQHQCHLHSQQTALLHSQQTALLHSQQTALLHSQQTALLHSQQTALLHSQQTALTDMSPAQPTDCTHRSRPL